MAGISVGVVFSILLVLVLVLTVFSLVVGSEKKEKPATLAAAPQTVAKSSDADEAAVATAVYLYLNGRHDEESGVLTIQVNRNSLWHKELNDRL